MVREVLVEGGHVAVTIALTVAGCPLRDELREPGARARAAAPRRRVGLARVRRDEPRRARHADAASCAAASPGARRASRSDASTSVLAIASGKGGVGKSTLSVNLAAAFDRLGQRAGILDADVYGHSIPHMLGDHAAPGRRRQDDRPARARRPEADVDRLLPRRELAGHVARADAAPRARAVPLRRALGRARHARRRHAAGHRRRRDLARTAAAARGGRRRHDAAAGRAAGRGPRGADGAEDGHAR